MLLMLIL